MFFQRFYSIACTIPLNAMNIIDNLVQRSHLHGKLVPLNALTWEIHKVMGR